MRLGVKVGQGCTALMDETVQDLPCTRLEMDVVEVFDLKGHPKTHRVYAWMHDTGDPAKPK